ncbi:MAG: phospholipase D-like domain-containing protein [Candidatus Eremiobacteraeota bacterium]|nr:phospholipase D-like domain-containing protein [Candidatus Eremiobacteraeota bacterium]
MLAIVALAQVAQSIRHSRVVSLTAYTLSQGPILEALEQACKNGARVRVRLEGIPHNDTHNGLRNHNCDTVERLRSLGADAAVNEAQPQLHMKAVIADSVAFLDDRNWPGNGGDTILRDDDAADVAAIADAMQGRPASKARLSTSKGNAVAAEANMLYASHCSHLEVQSESFTFSKEAYGALKRQALSGTKVRLIVSKRDIHKRERLALCKLQGYGVEVRVSESNEKLALAGTHAWIGSANATAGQPDEIDWGMKVDDRSIVRSLKARFEANWNCARAFGAPTN